MDREKRIKKEIKRLSKIYNCDKEKIKELIKRSSFLLVIAEDMEAELKEANFTAETINASQQFVKANPLLKEYRETIKTYQNCLKQLTDMTKDIIVSPQKDPLEEFNNELY